MGPRKLSINIHYKLILFKNVMLPTQNRIPHPFYSNASQMQSKKVEEALQIVSIISFNATFAQSARLGCALSSTVRRMFFFYSFISNQNYFRFYKIICCDSIYDLKRLIQ
jgi:hypothetical protein